MPTFNREQILVEAERGMPTRQRRRRAAKAAVDDQVNPSAIFSGDKSSSMAELTAAYSPPMPRPVTIRKEGETPEVPGQGAQQHAGKINDQGHVKDEATPEPIRNPTKS